MAFPLIPMAIGVLGGLAKRMRRNRQLQQQASQISGSSFGTQPASANQQTTPTSSISTAATSSPNTAQTQAGAANTQGQATIMPVASTGNEFQGLGGSGAGGGTGLNARMAANDRANAESQRQWEASRGNPTMRANDRANAESQRQWQSQGGAQPATTPGATDQQQGAGLSAAAMGAASKAKTKKKNLAQQAALNARSNT